MLHEKLYYVHRISALADTQDDENIQKYFLYLLPIIAEKENVVEEVETWPCNLKMIDMEMIASAESYSYCTSIQ